MNFLLKMLNFVLKMMNFVLKMMNFVLKMMIQPQSLGSILQRLRAIQEESDRSCSETDEIAIEKGASGRGWGFVGHDSGLQPHDSPRTDRAPAGFLTFFPAQFIACALAVSFQWKNPDFLLRNPDFLLKNG